MCGRVGELWVNVRVNSEWTPFEEIRKTRLATGLTDSSRARAHGIVGGVLPLLNGPSPAASTLGPCRSQPHHQQIPKPRDTLQQRKFSPVHLFWHPHLLHHTHIMASPSVQQIDPRRPGQYTLKIGKDLKSGSSKSSFSSVKCMDRVLLHIRNL